MGNDNPSEHVIMNLTCLNFLKLLLKEIGDYFYSFFEKKLSNFPFYQEQKIMKERMLIIVQLKEKKENISFDLYIEDILEFDPKFKIIFQLYQKSKVLAKRSSFIQYLKKNTLLYH